MSLTDVAVELYALPPAEFTAARNARVRQLRADGDRELARDVAALRRPTLAAWAVDLLVRHRPQDVEELLALGAGLLEAQAARAGDRLRALDREQHTRMAALRAQARRLAADAGQRLTGAVDVPLESTLRAAMTDADAAAAVRSGLLVTDLRSTGFGPVDVGDAVAVPGAPPLTGGRPAVAAGGGAAAGDDAVGDDAAVPGAEVALPRRAAARRAAAGQDAVERAAAERAAAERDRAERDRVERAAAERAVARRRERDRAEHDLAEAEARSAAADDAATRAEEEVVRATEATANAGAEVERLVAALTEARTRQASAALDEQRAATARDAAVAAAGTARRRARAARDRRDALT